MTRISATGQDTDQGLGVPADAGRAADASHSSPQAVSTTGGIPDATPGPWVARVSDGQWVVSRPRGDVLVAECGLAGPGYLTPEADARLIAAAPCLYRACVAFVACYPPALQIADERALEEAGCDPVEAALLANAVRALAKVRP